MVTGLVGLMAMVLAAVRRMGRVRRRVAPVVALGVAAAASTEANAQDDKPRLDIQRFEPVPAVQTFSMVRDAGQPEAGTFGAALSLNYALNPLEMGSLRGRSLGVVDHLVGLDLGLSYAPLDWLDIGVNVPFLQAPISAGDSQDLAAALGSTGNKVGFGDIQVAVGFAPLRQGSNSAVSLSVVPRLVIPSGARGEFLGSGAVGVGGDVALAKRWTHFRFSTMLGYQYNTASDAVANVYADDELRYGVGLGVPLRDDTWEVAAEWYGGTVLVPEGRQLLGDAWYGDVHTPMELLVTAMHAPKAAPIWVKFGAGTGLTHGWGSPDLRLIGTVGFRTSKVAKVAPPEPEPTPVDTDGDGLYDPDDGCPTEPEDRDEFEDADGCPDPDNDKDGILDVDDKCPKRPEDFDGFEDKNGCPDEDNDKDGVLDVRDGHRAADGSLVTDATYKEFGECMNAPEVVNGVDDKDGCPDEALAVVKDNEIVILDKVYFDYDKDTIKQVSHAVLDAVVTVMKEYPSIQLIEVQGHTDSRGSDAYNLDLSSRRAAQVREYLIAHGIEASRLTSKGYGETQPIIPNAQTEDEHARNRRVQFIILTTAEGAPEVKDVDQARPTAEE